MNIIEKLKNKSLTISTCESLTAGLLSSHICDISGASSVFKGGIVSYSKDIKCSLLNINRTDLDKYNVYSNFTSFNMAKSCKNIMNTDISISTTGVAGPNSDDGIAPGNVYFTIYFNDNLYFNYHNVFIGDRNKVREDAVIYILNKLSDILDNM